MFQVLRILMAAIVCMALLLAGLALVLGFVGVHFVSVQHGQVESATGLQPATEEAAATPGPPMAAGAQERGSFGPSPRMWMFPMIMLPVFFLLLFLFVWSVRVLRGENRTGPGSPQEEAELIQELHRTAERLEERMNALETIILEERDAQRARW